MDIGEPERIIEVEPEPIGKGVAGDGATDAV